VEPRAHDMAGMDSIHAGTLTHKGDDDAYPTDDRNSPSRPRQRQWRSCTRDRCDSGLRLDLHVLRRRLSRREDGSRSHAMHTVKCRLFGRLHRSGCGINATYRIERGGHQSHARCLCDSVPALRRWMWTSCLYAWALSHLRGNLPPLRAAMSGRRRQHHARRQFPTL